MSSTIATQTYELENYKDTLSPTLVKNKTIIKAKVVEITPKNVVLQTRIKFDTILSRDEFKDLPTLQKGDEVEVYLESNETKNKQTILSRKKLKIIKAWETITEAYNNQTPLDAIVQKTSPGGLIATIQDIEVFLPGSQINLKPVTDYQAFVNTTIQVIPIKINYKKKNIIVSRKLIIQNTQNEQKRALIEKIEKGQILEGTIKNIESYGLFVDLGGITGLMHIRDITHYIIFHPSELKDEEGNPMFEKEKKIKVVVLKIDKEKNHIFLSRKPLEQNPWEKLPEELKVNTTLKGTITKIINGLIVVKTPYGISGIIKGHDLVLSNKTLEVGKEVQTIISHIDIEKEVLNLRLTPDPWKTENFNTKFALNTCHEAIVIKRMTHGAWLKTVSGDVKGFLPNRHISWNEKITDSTQALKASQVCKVIVIGVDESKKILHFGLRELEQSPWDDYQETFKIGTTHQGTVLRKTPKGFIIQLQDGPETFIPTKSLDKKSEMVIGQKLSFTIVDFMKYEEKIHVSQYQTINKESKTTLQEVALIQDKAKNKKN